MAKILITGGSGLIGKAVTGLLLKLGHEVCWLSRKSGHHNEVRIYGWDPKQGSIDESAFAGTDHLIHLAGASISGRRWTEKYKRQIVQSRTNSTALLCETIKRCETPLKSFTGASAVGFYGLQTNNHLYGENDSAGTGFLAETCVLWEKGYECIAAAGIRTVIIRSAVVLAANKGALKKMKLPFMFGLGAPAGTGKQFFPWIHTDDIAAIYVRSCFQSSMRGLYNAAAPGHVTNREFTVELAKRLQKPLWLPAIPGFLMKLLYGEAATAITTGLKISSKKIIEEGFEFSYDKLSGALADLRI